MFVVLVWIIIALLSWAIPWKGMPIPRRIWAIAGALNAIACLSVPTTAATSPWRARMDALSAITYWASLILTLVGCALWFGSDAPNRKPRQWLAALILCALPFAAWSAVGLIFGLAYSR